MITARLRLISGALRELRVRGHANGGRNGKSIPCAGVSLLIKAVGLSVVDRDLIMEGGAPEEGDFFAVLRDDAEHYQWLCGISSVLVRGLQSIADEYPAEIKVIVQEEDDGT